MSGDAPPTEPTSPPPEAGEPTPSEAAERPRRMAEMRTRIETQRRRAQDRASDLRTRHASVRLAFETYEGDRRQAGGLLAGGLAFRFFLWLLPTALVVVSAVDLVAQVGSRPADEVAESMGLGAAMASVIADATLQSGRGSVVLLIIGLWLMVWACMSVVKSLRLMTSVAWRTPQPKLRRPILVGVVGSGIGIGLLASPYLLGILYAGPFGTDLLAFIGAIAAIGVAFIALSLWLPHPDDLAWSDLVPGAVLIAIGWEGLRLLTAVYLVGRLSRIEDLYGALGVSAVFMTWLYLIGRVLVAGTALNATRWRSQRAVKTETDTAEPAQG